MSAPKGKETVAYPLFPKLPANCIAEVVVWSVKKYKNKPHERERVISDLYRPEMTELELSRIVGGGSYEIHAYGAPNEEQELAVKEVRFRGAPKTPPPLRDSLEALHAPSAHETAQRAIITIPGLDASTNAILAVLQMQVEASRQGEQKITAAMLELLNTYITREKTTTLEQQLISELRAQNQKLSDDMTKLTKELQETELENVEAEARGKPRGILARAVDQIAGKVGDQLPELVKELGLNLLQNPAYVDRVAELHATAMAKGPEALAENAG